MLPTESGGVFQANQRLFRFSQAPLPSDEYMELRDDPNACSPTLELGGRETFYLSGTTYGESISAQIPCSARTYVRGLHEHLNISARSPAGLTPYDGRLI